MLMMVKIIIMVMVSYNRVTPLWLQPCCWQPGKQNQPIGPDECGRDFFDLERLDLGTSNNKELKLLSCLALLLCTLRIICRFS